MLHNIYFTEADMEAQLKTIVNFLSLVHPELNNNSYQNSCVELRPINRSPEFNMRLNRSLNLWRLDENSIDRLRDYLFMHNGEPYCMYYSVFGFDYQKEAYTQSGTRAKKGKITTDSALFAYEVVLDFDDISYVEVEALVKRFAAIGIDGIWIFTGHGYQLHILLEEPMLADGSLYKLIYLFRAKGFMCDPTCVDAARLMRLPFTYNCKCFSNEEYDREYNNPPLCKIIKESNKRYTLQSIIDKLMDMPTVSLEDEKFYNAGLVTPEEGNVNPLEIGSDLNSNSELISLSMPEYPSYLIFDDLPEPIVKMLKNTPMGFRNNSLGLLIKYFKQYLLFGKEQIYNILNTWAEYACEPSYNRLDFNNDFERLYQSGGLNYSSGLAKRFGYIDFENLIQLHRDNKVIISNTVFQNLDVIDGNVLRAYLGVKVLEHGNDENDEDTTPVTINVLSEITGMSLRNLRRVLLTAKSMNLIYMKQGAKRKGEPSTYHSSQINNSDSGFKALSVNDIDIYLSQSPRLSLKNNELKLYLFMLYKFYTKDRAMSLKKLGEHIGCHESTVSLAVSTLKKKKYLRIEKIYKDDIIFFNKYTLLK